MNGIENRPMPRVSISQEYEKYRKAFHSTFAQQLRETKTKPKKQTPMLLDLIKRAIAFISGQKSAVAALQAQLEERDNIINALRRQDVVEDAQLEEANAKSAAITATLAELETAGNDLANAINENPDTPIVSFGFEVLHDNGATSEPIPAPEPEAPAETTPDAEPETPAPDSVGEKEAEE